MDLAGVGDVEEFFLVGNQEYPRNVKGFIVGLGHINYFMDFCLRIFAINIRLTITCIFQRHNLQKGKYT